MGSGYAEEAWISAECARSLPQDSSPLRSKHIQWQQRCCHINLLQFWGQKGRSVAAALCCFLDMNFCMSLSEARSKLRKNAVDELILFSKDPSWPRVDPRLCSTIQVVSLCPQEDTDGGCLSADAFKCQNHEKKTHWHSCLSLGHCSHAPNDSHVGERGEILKQQRIPYHGEQLIL